MLSSCTIRNYRSIRDLDLPLGQVTVLLGPNGCGKTNCYRALRLAHAAASGRLAEHFAEEGGMPSALWAGQRSTRDVGQMRLEVAVELAEFSYRIACGITTPKTYGQPEDRQTPHVPKPSFFATDPEVKEEEIAATVPGHRRAVTLCQRHALACSLRDEHGAIAQAELLDPNESVLSQISDPRQYGELALVRQVLSLWRFYHQFRTDSESPLRQPRLATRSPILASDGANLAAALQTIVELDGEEILTAAIDRAFPGSAVTIAKDAHGRLSLAMTKPGLQRALSAAELSDGTLRFLCLAAALLSPRPAPFLALNEPETSLHPELIPALTDLVVAASKGSQVLLTTHSVALAEGIARATGLEPMRLSLSPAGETELEHRGGLLKPRLVRRSKDA